MELNVSWWAAAIVNSIALATYLTINQHFKIKGSVLMVYRGLVKAILCIPLMLFFPPVSGWEFYFFTALLGLLMSYVDNRYMNAISKFGAEIPASFQPLTVVVSFVVWWLIDKEEFFAISQNLWVLFGVLSCLLMAAASMWLLSKSKFSMQAFRYLLLALIMIVFGDIIFKLAMENGEENFISALVYFTFVISLFIGIPNLIVVIKEKDVKLLFEKKSFFVGMTMILVISIVTISKGYALLKVPNPAYVSMFNNSYAVWVIIYGLLYNAFYKKYKYPRVNPIVLLLFVLSAVGLIYLTS